MATMLETPSRIWRRIEAIEGQDMPSLPSLPAFEDSVAASSEGVDDDSEKLNDFSTPVHSTPAATSSHTVASTIRPSSTSSTTRFAHSIASRSTKSVTSSSLSRGMSTRHTPAESFDVSAIPSLPDMHEDSNPPRFEDPGLDETRESLPDVYLPPEEDDPDESLSDALQSVSRASSPVLVEHPEHASTQKKVYDYSVSLRSEPKPSPYEKFRNVSFRKPTARTRTPSLTHTTSSSGQDDNSDLHTSGDGSRPPSEREPTFSSDNDPTPYSHRTLHQHLSPIPVPSTVSSPMPSEAFTPTPAGPRTRFNIPVSDLPGTPSQQHTELEDEDPVTPHTRRRSFLLSVINSTARPRLTTTPGMRNGATPLPKVRVRLSHPLAQTYIPSVDDSGSESGPDKTLPRWEIPGVCEDDRASTVSTASSHDLTTHQRANTSYDPAIGLGAQGHGVGRFNAGKLNAYLHGLNRRLQEENEGLVERLKRLEEESSATPPGNGLSYPQENSRRASLGEGWVEEKAELEKTVEAFRMEVQRCIAEREETETALEEERKERARDKERWRERMAEVEKGVEEIVKDLERKLREADKQRKEADNDKEAAVKSLQRRLAEVEEGRCAAIERARKAEEVAGSEREAARDLAEANERVDKVMGDLRNANAQIRELQDEVLRSDSRVDELEKELREEKESAGRLEDELKANLDELNRARRNLKGIDDRLKKLQEELQATNAYTAELEEGAAGAIERLEHLEEELASANATIKTIRSSEELANERAERSEGEARKKTELIRQLEEALDAAEKKMLIDEEEIAGLKSQLAALNRQRERALENTVRQGDESRPSGPSDADVDALEDELAGAHKEIARLTTLLNQSPARKAIEKAKDTKIETLEMEKEELMERVNALRVTLSDKGTPSNTSSVTPIHRHGRSISVRAPKTPGGPLKDLSWLNNTAANPTVAPLVSEIFRLQKELDRANESIDDKLDQLGDAGSGLDRSDIARALAALEVDLKRVCTYAEELGGGLRQLRSEKERSEGKQQDELSKAEKARRQADAQIRLLTDQLESQRQRATGAKEELENHVCVMDEHQLSALKLQHNKECKGLIAQIRYLKAKFTRESGLRCALVYQKQYLTTLLAKFEKSEKSVSAAIARIGFPVQSPPPPKKLRSLKSVALAIVFVVRVRKTSEQWQEQRASRTDIVAALQEVWERRALRS